MNDNKSIPITELAQPFFLPGNDIGIVLIHGYGGSIADYRDLGERLNKNGYTVLGLRLTGHGQGQQALRKSKLPEWQKSLSDAVNEIKKTCQNIFLVGSSFGGVLALDYSERHDDVSGLVLVNTALSYSGAGVFQGVALRIMKLFRPDYPKKGLTEEERQYARKIGSSEAWPIDGILATSYFAKHVVVPALPKITVPALIMHSDSDPVVGTKNSEKLAALLGSKSKELLTIPVATHRPFRNEQANSFMAEKIKNFIQTAVANV